MDTSNLIELTLYLVGNTEADALEGMPFDSIESADSYANDEGGEIYEVSAWIDPTTITLSSGVSFQ